MADISSALRSTIPISLFNRGMAGKVFEDVRRQGAKVVMKNNSPASFSRRKNISASSTK